MQTRNTGLYNRDFAKDNPTFKLACEAAGVQPTKRQASKYRRGIGRAFEASKRRTEIKPNA